MIITTICAHEYVYSSQVYHVLCFLSKLSIHPSASLLPSESLNLEILIYYFF
jgi:hypothetical protein